MYADRFRPTQNHDGVTCPPPGTDPSSATFTLHHEDHTIGNTMRYILNKTPEVSFCGYSVPHPAEPRMNLRLQTIGPPATEVLLDALLPSVCLALTMLLFGKNASLDATDVLLNGVAIGFVLVIDDELPQAIIT